ncbi:MAG: TonB-dependent receptor [Prolixibacteraceae bacterium]|nr:TonB-dependent receptor [Prolixibacteraceae bacterium]MBT6765267.1 TonB-dependent receptor [Prolixibacteraceae bacterium]MBT6997801.1 TonB-dependent receptor [Prolixibacteraceae bacterium]MBT7396794.1 TonB-dependent receptor [Prolixibacteraceae bacterium]
MTGLQLQAQTTLTGKVLDSNDNEPLVGASVSVAGTTLGSATSIDGTFSLNVENLPVKLSISFIGYQTKVIDVKVAEPLVIKLSTAATSMEVLVVVGSRGRPRTVMASPVPIDNINIAELKSSGQSSLDQMLTFKVPSYNSTSQTISDATAHFDPSELRNLGPSRTLVLVNGKRKNQSAQVYVNETPGRGEVGTDMKSIPASAIERIEVLRDGASAQFGSDAIAGVINIILKKRVNDFELNLATGITSMGDGLTYSGDLNKGFKIGEKGFLNLTGSFYHQDYTNRAGEPGGDGLFGFLYDIGAIPIEAAGGFEATPGNIATGAQIRSGDTDWQRANPGLGMVVGQPTYDKYSAFANFGVEHDLGELYANAGYTKRNGVSSALFRTPYWPGVPTDATSNPLYNGVGAYEGFLPTFETSIDDYIFTAGNIFKVDEWSIDVSATTGSNKVDYTVGNTINPSYGAASPIDFNVGGYSFSHLVGNIDVQRTFNKVDFSFGMEARNEVYDVRAGQEESYLNGGAQSFPGLQPSNELNENRSNIGVYTGIDYDVSESFLVGGAVRLENYSDFGTNISWKLNARQLLANNKGAFRASVGTGFRAPSLHQIYLSNVQTLVVDGNIQQEGTFNNVDPVIRDLLGIPALDAEQAFNFSAGFTFNLLDNLSFAVDYYNIKVDNRVLFSNQISTGALPDGNPVRTNLQNSGVEAFKFFVNALDTRTAGLDVVLSYNNIKMGTNKDLDIVLALNSNKTSILGEINAPQVFEDAGIEIFNREEKARVTSARPDLKVNLGLNLTMKDFNVSLNNTYFGAVTWRHPGDETLDQTFSGKVLTDLILGYRLSEKININLTANNILNVYPDVIESGGDFDTDLGGRFKYPWEVNQFGFMGAMFKLGVNFKF